MQVNSVKTQNFGANPSYAIRKSLAKAQVGGKDITELLGLIKEVHPQKYMTIFILYVFRSVAQLGRAQRSGR